MSTYAYDSANDALELVAGAPKSRLDKIESNCTTISITGTVNNTGSAITAGSFFYLNGDMVRAKVAIANGATLTLNTNYEVPSLGALNALNSALANIRKVKTAIKIVHFDSYSNGNVTNTFGLGKINVLSATSNLDSIILLPFYVRTGEQIWLKAINEQTFLPISSATDMIVTIEYVEV